MRHDLTHLTCNFAVVNIKQGIMAQITINIQTLDWTMGETVGLLLMLKKDSKARIAWGDGKVQVVTGKQEPASEKLAWVEAGH